MKQKKYPTYKPSGVEWIGDVPKHWGVKRLRFLLTPDGVKIGPFGSDLKYEHIKDAGIKIHGQEHVIKDDFTLGKKYIDHDKFAELEAYELSPGDIVVTMMGTTGRCKVFPEGVEKGIMDSHLTRLRTKSDEYLPQLLALVVNDSYFVFGQLKWHSKGSIMEGLNSTIIRSLVIPVPNIEEQQQILKYITEKKKIIEETIRKKEKLIELLQEERTAIINQAVTRGLDTNVKMKDSGVEWLGEIPEHWEVKKLKFALTIKNGDGIKQEDLVSNEGYPAYGGNGVIGNHKSYNHDGIALVVGRVGAKCGNVHLTSGKKWVSDNALITETTENPFYIYNLLTALDLNKYATQNAQPLITGTTIKEQVVALPPINEQSIISDFISKKNSIAYSTIAKIEQELLLLYEYRTALINEVVTGKRCVI